MSCQTSNESISCWFVYIILTSQHSLYTGITKDLERRFQEHVDTANGKPKAKGAKFFRRARPLKIVYAEQLADRSLASKREAEIKSMSSQQKQELIKT